MMNNSREELEFADISLLAITRVALGAGIGLLLAQKFGNGRRAAGWALLTIGAVTTVPLAIKVLKGLKACNTSARNELSTAK
ncbi:MAG: hypothetical protein ABJA02_09355 [Acidobacteriota bacterium]